jgi:putative endonuclease
MRCFSVAKFWVYIIQSEKNTWTYTGNTNNIKRRLCEHNMGKMSSTRHHRPFKLIYTEEFSSRREAMSRERFLKTGQGREVRKELLRQHRQK